MDGDLNDVSGNAHNGIVQGNVSFVQSLFTEAIQFNSAEQNVGLIYIPPSEAFSFERNMTLSFWIFRKGDGYVFDKSSKFGDWAVDSHSLFYYRNRLDNTLISPSEGGAIPRNVWTHVAIVKSHDLLFYINGRLLGSASLSEASIQMNPSSYLLIGCSNEAPDTATVPTLDNIGHCMYGALDEVYVYNRTLSATEISLLYSLVPTANPTAVPTIKPTFVPTFISTESPSSVPSSVPSTFPTAIPSETPTSSPTQTPTIVPTAEPTVSPSNVPTTFPTSKPTFEPTSEPTAVPSEDPTVTPTALPTEIPTNVPTFEPSADPSSFPSVAPTFSPTIVPTVEPSELPTESPTNVPSAEPSNLPTAIPTTAPTLEPSAANPTVPPTNSPTESPTVIPTNPPSFFPTAEPSETPTASPTNPPTETPTAIPTIIPSCAPTKTPTFAPTATPTTSNPTANPTFKPTAMPTFVPTAVPSTKTPTAVPTLARTPLRLDSGLIAHYSFDGNMEDSSGNEYHGVLLGNVSYIPSPSGYGIHFSNINGQDGLVYINETVAFSFDESMTIAFWLLRVGDGMVFDKSSNFGDWAVDSHVEYYYSDRRSRVIGPQQEAAVPRNTWTHVGIVKSANTIKYYVNGKKTAVYPIVANGMDPIMSTQPASYLLFGGLNTEETLGQKPSIETAIFGFEGGLDEVYIYNRSLTGPEVAALSTTIPTQSPTIAPSSPTMSPTVNLLNLYTNRLYVLAGQENYCGYGTDGVLASSTNGYRMVGFWKDSIGNIYITEAPDLPWTSWSRVRKIAAGKNTLKTLFFGNRLLAIWGDEKYLYFSDEGTNIIYKMDLQTTTNVIAIAKGNGFNAYPATGVNSLTIKTTANGLWTNPISGVFVADSLNGMIFTIKNNIVTVIAGGGSIACCRVASTNPLSLNLAVRAMAPGVFRSGVNAKGEPIDRSLIYFAQPGSISVIDMTNGNMSVVAGQYPRIPTTIDNAVLGTPALQTGFGNINSLTRDEAGNLYFTDMTHVLGIPAATGLVQRLTSGKGWVGIYLDTKRQHLLLGGGNCAAYVFCGDLTNPYGSVGSPAPSLAPTTAPTESLAESYYYSPPTAPLPVLSPLRTNYVQRYAGIPFYPGGYWVDTTGNLYATTSVGQIYKVDAVTKQMTIFAGIANSQGNIDTLGQGLPATSVKLGSLAAIWGDENYLYFGDLTTNTVRTISWTTGLLGTIVGGAVSQITAANGVPAANIRVQAKGLWSNAISGLFVADSNANAIYSVKNGIVHVIAGMGSIACCRTFSSNPTSLKLNLRSLFGVFRSSNNGLTDQSLIYFAQPNSISMIDLSTNNMTAIAGYYPNSVYFNPRSAGKPPLQSGFMDIASITGDNEGNIYFTENKQLLALNAETGLIQILQFGFGFTPPVFLDQVNQNLYYDSVTLMTANSAYASTRRRLTLTSDEEMKEEEKEKREMKQEIPLNNVGKEKTSLRRMMM